MNKKIPITCPCNQKKNLKKINSNLVCQKKNCIHNNTSHGFKIINSIPIIISEFNTDTIFHNRTFESYLKRTSTRFKKIKNIFIGKSEITTKNCAKFINNLFKLSRYPKVLVIGGAEKGSGTEKLWNNKKLELHSIDVYASENVDVICDAHYLPFKNNYYDGVWIQAVLEHVVEPDKVVEEIYRVLKINGLVYSETPFMQQVHEGAYDFHRFTILGHRYLFKKFKLIEIGGNGGTEIVFAWSIKYLFWSIFRNKKISTILGILITLLVKPLKLITSKKSLYDGSSGVFFLGKKTIEHRLFHKDLIKLYKGHF